MAKKNPHAVALGRRGGRANTEAQQTARRLNGLKGGQPRKYRIDKATGWLERRDVDGWWLLTPPYDRAGREALRRLKRHGT